MRPNEHSPLHVRQAYHLSYGTKRPIRKLNAAGLLPVDDLAAVLALAGEIAAKKKERYTGSNEHRGVRKVYETDEHTALRRWDSRKQAAERAQERAAEIEREKQERERRKKIAKQWLEAPSRWRRSRRDLQLDCDPYLSNLRVFARSLAARQVDVIAHALMRRGWVLDYRSPSGSAYLFQYGLRIRLANHQLGYADYGTREQFHSGGPEYVFDAGDQDINIANCVEGIDDECRELSLDGALQ